MTDGLEQYHKLARELEGVTNANCMAHARRHFANAVKAIGKGNEKAIQSSIAYKALVRIGAIYKLGGALRKLTAEERLKERQASIKPLVEEYFAWVRELCSDQTVLPKGETSKGLNYSLNQEEYLKVFLTDGEVPIDDSASERALRNFTVGRKNWVTINTVRGVQASAVIYSITETARANNLNVYYYIRYLLTELIKRKDKDGNIDEAMLIPCAHSAGIKRDHLFLNPGNVPLIFRNQFWLKLTITVTGHINLKFPILALKCFRGMPISFIPVFEINFTIFS